MLSHLFAISLVLTQPSISKADCTQVARRSLESEASHRFDFSVFSRYAENIMLCGATKENAIKSAINACYYYDSHCKEQELRAVLNSLPEHVTQHESSDAGTDSLAQVELSLNNIQTILSEQEFRINSLESSMKSSRQLIDPKRLRSHKRKAIIGSIVGTVLWGIGTSLVAVGATRTSFNDELVMIPIAFGTIFLGAGTGLEIMGITNAVSYRHDIDNAVVNYLKVDNK